LTTIAYKDGIVAYDSRATQGGQIATNKVNKLAKRGKDWIAWAGTLGEGEKVLEALVQDVYPQDLGFGCGVAMLSGIVHRVSLNNEELYKIPVETIGGTMACGSGGEYAYGAMDAGASAIEAVKIAIGRDVYSGGSVKHLKIGAKL